MEKKTIVIQTREPELHECQLCGKKDKDVILFAGGFIGWAHEDCAELANKAVGLYLRCLGSDQGMTRLASDYLENEGFTVHYNGGQED